MLKFVCVVSYVAFGPLSFYLPIIVHLLWFLFKNDSQKDDKKASETPIVPDALAALKEESKENMTKCFVDISEAMISPASVKKVKRMSAKRKVCFWDALFLHLNHVII